MYQAGYYAGKSEDEIRLEMTREGLQPERVEDAPNSVYDGHKNFNDLLLAFVHGGAEIHVGDDVYQCGAGDRLTILGVVEHSAKVGPEGCVYLMSPLPVSTD